MQVSRTQAWTNHMKKCVPSWTVIITCRKRSFHSPDLFSLVQKQDSIEDKACAVFFTAVLFRPPRQKGPRGRHIYGSHAISSMIRRSTKGPGEIRLSPHRPSLRPSFAANTLSEQKLGE